MSEIKNINVDSEFEDRIGLVVWLKSKRNVKRLMNYGFLHYISKKMDYALLYVDTDKLDKTIERLKKEKNVQSVEISKLRDLPIHYDDVLPELRKEIEKKKQKKNDEFEIFKSENRFENED